MSLLPFLAAFLVMLSSLSGIIFAGRQTKRLFEANLTYLVSFSAGVFLVVATGLVLEAWELLASPVYALLMVVLGYSFAFLLHRLMPETHHHHDEHCERSHGGARKLLIGGAIHNVADGVVLASAFYISTSLGLVATTSILIHEALQKISEFIVLRQSGYRASRALFLNFVVSGTILLGVVIGYVAVVSEGFEGILLAVSAGFFTHVVVHDLLPTRHVRKDSRAALPHIFLVALGAVTMATISAYLADLHPHHGGDESELHSS